MIYINISFTLLAIIIIVFIAQLVVPGFTDIFKFNPQALAPWQFITSIFLHSTEDFNHIIFNTIGILMFGPYLEKRIGSKNFLILFLLAGISGSLLYYITILLGVIPPNSAYGASGAIYGILGALSVLVPRLVIYFYFVPMPIRIATVLWILIELLGSFNPYSKIASAAHLGGLLFGIVFGLWYRNKVPGPESRVLNSESRNPSNVPKGYFED